MDPMDSLSCQKILGFSLTDPANKAYNHDRLKELGLNSLFTEEGGSKNLLSRMQFISTIDEGMWKTAAQLKNRKFTHYSKKEVIAAINFLEKFAVWLSVKGPSEKSSDPNQVDVTKKEEKFKKQTSQTISLLENLRKSVDLPEKMQKNTKLSSKFKKPGELIEKLYDTFLSTTEQVALQKPLKKALKCLKEHYK